MDRNRPSEALLETDARIRELEENANWLVGTIMPRYDPYAPEIETWDRELLSHMWMLCREYEFRYWIVRLGL